jgi:hypothetical protein
MAVQTVGRQHTNYNSPKRVYHSRSSRGEKKSRALERKRKQMREVLSPRTRERPKEGKTILERTGMTRTSTQH